MGLAFIGSTLTAHAQETSAALAAQFLASSNSLALLGTAAPSASASANLPYMTKAEAVLPGTPVPTLQQFPQKNQTPKLLFVVDLAAAQETIFKLWAPHAAARWANATSPYPDAAIRELMDDLTTRLLIDSSQNPFAVSNWNSPDPIQKTTRIPLQVLAPWIKNRLRVDYIVLKGAQGNQIMEQYGYREISVLRSAGLFVIGHHKLTFKGLKNAAYNTESADATLRLLLGPDSGPIWRGMVSGVLLVPSEDFVRRADSTYIQAYFAALESKVSQTTTPLLSNFAYLREPFGRKVDRFAAVDQEFLSRISCAFIPVYWGYANPDSSKAHQMLTAQVNYWCSSDTRSYVFVGQTDCLFGDPTEVGQQESYLGQMMAGLSQRYYNPGSARENSAKQGYAGMGLYCLEEVTIPDLKSYLQPCSSSGTFPELPCNNVASVSNYSLANAISTFANSISSGTEVRTLPGLANYTADNRNRNWCWANVVAAVKTMRGTPTAAIDIYNAYSNSACGTTDDIGEPACSAPMAADFVLLKEGLLAQEYEQGAVDCERIWDYLEDQGAGNNRPGAVVITLGSGKSNHFVIVAGLARNTATKTYRMLLYDPADRKHGGVKEVDPATWFVRESNTQWLGTSWCVRK